MTPKRRPTESRESFKVRTAIETLVAYGRTCYKDREIHSNDDYARGFGIAIAPYFTSRAIVILAGEALEDNNAHGAAAVVRELLITTRRMIN
jgi:hypothetical protein